MVEETPVEEVPVVDKVPTVLVNGIECRTMKEMILYKMDRTFAILGIVLMGTWAIAKGSEMPASGIQIVGLAITALATYVGGRTGK